MFEPATVTVFCGSSTGSDPRFVAAARDFALAMAERDLDLVYGGGNCGIMGAVADAALAHGRAVVGVIPDFLVQSEHAHTGLTRIEVVSSMHERKARMAELGGAFVALPGGLGTFEELFEVLTWSQLGIHAKPIGVLEVAAYFEPLVALVDKASEQGFVRPQDRERLVVSESPAELLQGLAAAEIIPSSIVNLRKRS